MPVVLLLAFYISKAVDLVHLQPLMNVVVIFNYFEIVVDDLVVEGLKCH